MAATTAAPAPLWSVFDASWTAMTGSPASAFAFTPSTAPFATLKSTVSMMAVYYAAIFGGRELMRNRPAFQLKTPFMLHNFFLTALSGGLLVLFLEQIVPTLWRRGVYDSVCAADAGWTEPLNLLYYLNYLTKYVEFIDTVFLVLKKKPLTFLHTYHHGATALLCFVQMAGRTPVSWVPITLNLSVHCVMYFYYFQSARGVQCWWKRHITVMQIVQFVIDLGFVYFTAYNLFVSRHLADVLPHVGACDGGEVAAVTGAAILTSYLFLFVAFYFATYKKKAPAAKSAAQKASDLHRVASKASVALAAGGVKLMPAIKE
ncbi:fatty acid elongase [Diplodia corticola]|uniref:Elongation of fatty acids protein n=1 Tax=Diplodia corticola TaxID=236234 RepID=A0A1J9RP95_9PEZI|nr:fatty acid elongase [Diplodia corticola]OJD29389.1 fatty acid elongase [Diplodia corticola]